MIALAGNLHLLKQATRWKTCSKSTEFELLQLEIQQAATRKEMNGSDDEINDLKKQAWCILVLSCMRANARVTAQPAKNVLNWQAMTSFDYVQLQSFTKTRTKLEQDLKSANTARNMIVEQLRNAEKAAR